MQKRLNRVLLCTGIALGAGLAYALLIRIVGFGIPCMFHMLTGLDCASCGISRMCMALLQLRFAEAFHHNPAIFCMLPLGAAVLLVWAVRYVRTGRKNLAPWMYAAIVFMAVVLILFGIVRNLV